MKVNKWSDERSKMCDIIAAMRQPSIDNADMRSLHEIMISRSFVNETPETHTHNPPNHSDWALFRGQPQNYKVHHETVDRQ